MRIIDRLVLTVLLAGMLGHSGFAAALKEGQAAPAIEAKSLDGRLINPEKLKGKVVLLHYWATWCPPCREEMPILEQFYQAHGKEGFEIVAISVEESSDEALVRDFTKAYSFPIVMKGDANTKGYGRVWALPLSFVIDRKGLLRKIDWTGEQKIDAANLERYVLPLLRKD